MSLQKQYGDMYMTIEETLRIALDAHNGQKDLDGKPAVLHTLP